MRRYLMSGTTLALAVALAIPTLVTISAGSVGSAKAAAKSEETASGADNTPSKEDQAKLKEHNKLRAEIARQKYPAGKAEVLAHVKGIKTDDKKWFAETLPDRVYSSADDVMTALGWEASPPSEKDSGKDKKKSQ